jgi:hypothetical protein
LFLDVADSHRATNELVCKHVFVPELPDDGRLCEGELVIFVVLPYILLRASLAKNACPSRKVGARAGGSLMTSTSPNDPSGS